MQVIAGRSREIRRGKRALGVAMCFGLSTSAYALSTLPQPMSVADAIETARFHVNYKGEAAFVSPNRQRYVSLVVRGDIKKDGVWMDVLTGRLGSLDSSGPRLIASLFTRALSPAAPVVIDPSGPSALLSPGSNIPAWIGNEEIALLWEDSTGHNQIFGINVSSKTMRQLTHEATDVVDFTFGANKSLAYDVKAGYSPERSQYLVGSGFPVKSPDAMALLSWIVDGTGIFDLAMCKRVVAVEKDGAYRRQMISNADIACDLSQSYLRGTTGVKPIAPDGRHLIANVQVSKIPQEWSVYRGNFGAYLKDAKENSRGFAASGISEFVIVDLASGALRPLWPAPANTDPWSTFAWSPDSRRVLIAPTMLPATSSDAAGLEGRAVAIVDVHKGSYERVPIDPDIAAKIFSVEWIVRNRITFVLRDGQTLAFDSIQGKWQRSRVGSAGDKAEPLKGGARRIVVGIHQDMNQPPVLIGTDVRTGRSRNLFDPNPGLLTRFALGRVELTHWADASGRNWEGRLYYPAHFRSGVRYPLVIQTHGYAGKDQFSIYGQGSPGGGVPLGPGWSVYLAQPLAGRDIAVLQIGGPNDGMSRQDTDFERTKSRAKTLEDAAEHLVGIGLIDRDKIGIMGHSATGREIEAALVFTDFPYAAAIAADHSDLNYIQSAEYGWFHQEGMPAPFGGDLEVWLNESPAFNVERIQTPLQLEVTTGGEGNSTLLWGWEMFSRLRYLRKPVEYYVVPDIKHGGHLLQNPRQLLALQNRALDWWLFWLASYEDPSIEKTPQYQDWRALRALNMVDMSRPKPPLRNWRSAP
jgi:hypothetical protein